MGSKHSLVTHTEYTDWEAFPCSDQSVLQISLNPKIREVLSGVSLLQFCTKDQLKRGND